MAKAYGTVPIIRWKGICLKCHQPVFREGVWRDGRWWHREHAPPVKPVQYQLDMNPAIAKGDMKFLSKAADAMGVGPVEVEWSESKAKYPDIWVSGKTITVTQEWAKQAVDERRKRLVHELAHLSGEQHGRKGKLTYSTYPAQDTYSKAVYRKLFKNPGQCSWCWKPVSESNGIRVDKLLIHPRCYNQYKEALALEKQLAVLATEPYYYDKGKVIESMSNPEVLSNTGTWFSQEHRTKEERRELYKKLQEAGGDPAFASKYRDYQPYKIRRIVIPHVLKPETPEQVQAVEELREMISPERLRDPERLRQLAREKEEARRRKESRQKNPKGRSLFPFLLAAAMIGIPYLLYKRNQNKVIAGRKPACLKGGPK